MVRVRMILTRLIVLAAIAATRTARGDEGTARAAGPCPWLDQG